MGPEIVLPRNGLLLFEESAVLSLVTNATAARNTLSRCQKQKGAPGFEGAEGDAVFKVSKRNQIL